MNRDIKFRAFVKDYDGSKHMLKEAFCFLDKKNNQFMGADLTNDYPCILEVLDIMQFTGLKDKKGKEIYEGDIIEYTQHNSYKLGGFKAKIVYNKHKACFGYIKTKPFIPNFINSFAETDELKYDLLAYTEVIGNIYENSELLKKI